MTSNTPPEVLALAREIARPHMREEWDEICLGWWDHMPAIEAAIAAIMEVTERAAKSIENRGDCDVYPWGSCFADELRNWEHLKQ